MIIVSLAGLGVVRAMVRRYVLCIIAVNLVLGIMAVSLLSTRMMVLMPVVFAIVVNVFVFVMTLALVNIFGIGGVGILRRVGCGLDRCGRIVRGLVFGQSGRAGRVRIVMGRGVIRMIRVNLIIGRVRMSSGPARVVMSMLMIHAIRSGMFVAVQVRTVIGMVIGR